MKIRIVKNKKGVSPIFVAIYLAMLAVLLISVLFGALYIYGTAVTERMKMEEERQQESVGLAGPKALNLTASSIVEALRVNNTGTITIRIRALYIGHKFICDPSTFQGDAYINPKKHIWIQLYPYATIEVNQTTLDAYWTVTTERGTKARETGARLLYGEDEEGPYNPMRFYIGPLMIMFDMFHWREGTGPWMNGWSIPKNTPDVTWRILISNIDDRDIEVTEKSSFTLISNDNAPSNPVAWYIDPVLSSTYYKPGGFYFVYYSWSKPFSEGGSSPQSTNGFGDGTTCTNFLMFLGAFIEPNGTRTSYGQTIPFEAVHVVTETMPNSLVLTANPQVILNDGVSNSTITATVTDAKGTPVPNAWVDFYTTAGTFSPTYTTTHTYALTDSTGKATVTLRSTTAKTTAYIAALCQGAEGTTKVSFTTARVIKLSPSSISVRKGATAQITVQLGYWNGTNFINVNQSGVTITVKLTSNKKIGQIEWGDPPQIGYGGQVNSFITVTTDANGQAIITFRASSSVTGTGTITAEATGLTMYPPTGVSVEVTAK